MTLDEAWKESYRQYLKETEDSINSIMTEMLEANAEASRGFELLKEYFMMYPVNEEVTGYAPEADYRDSGSESGNSRSAETQNSGSSSNPYALMNLSSSLIVYLPGASPEI